MVSLLSVQNGRRAVAVFDAMQVKIAQVKPATGMVLVQSGEQAWRELIRACVEKVFQSWKPLDEFREGFPELVGYFGHRVLIPTIIYAVVARVVRFLKPAINSSFVIDPFRG